MNVISLVGSPHGAKGNTAHLLEQVLDGAREMGAHAETIYLEGGSVLPCRACNRCHIKGDCSQKDAFSDIRQRIEAADGLILASPNYIFSVSAQMKAFLDRCCGVVHRLGFKGKYGAAVVTSGGGDEKPIAAYLNHFLITTGVTPVGAVWATMGDLDPDRIPEDIRRKAANLGRKLVRSFRQGRTFAGVDRKMRAFEERMRTLMLYRGAQWPYEYDFWSKQGKI